MTHRACSSDGQSSGFLRAAPRSESEPNNPRTAYLPPYSTHRKRAPRGPLPASLVPPVCKICFNCGDEYGPRAKEQTAGWRRRRFCSSSCAKRFRDGQPDRYRRICVNGRSVYEHRVIMARLLGRPLLRREVVHHRDGDKQNNDPANLELTNPTDHGVYHHSKPKVAFVCPVCKSEDAVLPSFKGRTCSAACAGALRLSHLRTAARTCEHCGRLFTLNPNGGFQGRREWSKRRFCSLRCAALYRWSHGDGHGTAKIDRQDAERIRDYRRAGMPVAEVAARFGIHGTTVSHITAGRIWR